MRCQRGVGVWDSLFRATGPPLSYFIVHGKLAEDNRAISPPPPPPRARAPVVTCLDAPVLSPLPHNCLQQGDGRSAVVNPLSPRPGGPVLDAFHISTFFPVFWPPPFIFHFFSIFFFCIYVSFFFFVLFFAAACLFLRMFCFSYPLRLTCECIFSRLLCLVLIVCDPQSRHLSYDGKDRHGHWVRRMSASRSNCLM